MKYSTIKQMFDYVFAILLLVLLLPILILISMVIKLDTKGPIFYKAIRIGCDQKQFGIYKFRTMIVDADQLYQGTMQKDKRITRSGKWMRKLSLDELPQLYNVLMGEMSFIGPRPHRTDLDERFRKEFDNYSKRYAVLPGISGLAQIKGWRGPTETVVQREMRVHFDTVYSRNRSFTLDLYILTMTIISAKSLKAAY